MADRAIAVDATGRRWAGWWIEPDGLTPPGHEAFVPDAPPDGDPDTVWYVPAERLRRVAEREP